MTPPRFSPDITPAEDILEFLNAIEGAGYGGMASFEIARQHARDMVRGNSQAPPNDDGATSAVIAEAYSTLGLELTVPQARRFARAALSSVPAPPGLAPSTEG
jgi:hypothetical protein